MLRGNGVDALCEKDRKMRLYAATPTSLYLLIPAAVPAVPFSALLVEPYRGTWASGPRRAVRRGRWKYLWDGGFGYLFDLWRDPGETRNVLYEHEALARELEALSLSEW